MACDEFFAVAGGEFLFVLFGHSREVFVELLIVLFEVFLVFRRSGSKGISDVLCFFSCFFRSEPDVRVKGAVCLDFILIRQADGVDSLGCNDSDGAVFHALEHLWRPAFHAHPVVDEDFGIFYAHHVGCFRFKFVGFCAVRYDDSDSYAVSPDGLRELFHGSKGYGDGNFPCRGRCRRFLFLATACCNDEASCRAS